MEEGVVIGNDVAGNSARSVRIGELWDKFHGSGCREEVLPSGHELVYPGNLKVRGIGNQFRKVKCLSRHRTTKHLVRIHFMESDALTTTTDHVCMAYNDDAMLESVQAKDLRPGMVVDRYCRMADREVLDQISKIEDLGPTEDWVYDLEVEDESHVFYANDVLVHNSFFMNLEAVTKDRIQQFHLPEDMNSWTPEQKLEMFDHMQRFADEYLIPRVHEIVAREFHTSNAKVMRYGLEYMGSGGIYESPKHYIVHKIVEEGPRVVDKFKYTGIELKKATIPPEIKKFMKDIYFTAVLDSSFNESTMRQKLDLVYQEMLKMTPNELGIWKGYNTERGMVGFLVEEKGATGVSKCANYYNQIVKKLGLDRKYPLINLKDKIQTIYLKPTNRMGIDQIGFPPHQWPIEFSELFEVDRARMVKTLIVQPLGGFLRAMKMEGVLKYNPAEAASLEYSVDDL